MNTHTALAPQSLTLTRRAPQNTAEYSYAVIDSNQRVLKGLIKAHSRNAARDQLFLRYDNILSLEEVTHQSVAQILAGYQDRTGSLPVYTRSISTMMEAGLPLVRIFEIVAQGEDDYLNNVMRDVADSLRQGRTLTASLSRWKSVFDSTYIGMIHAAEQTGRLHKTFGRLASLLERRWKIKQQVKAAFSYPMVICVVALAIFWVLVAFVVPQITPSFTAIGAEMPWVTQVLLSLGSLSTSWPLVLGLTLTVVSGTVLAYRIVVRGERFPQVALLLDQIRFRLPVIGELFELAALSYTLSNLAAMLESGLPLAKALSVGGKVSGSPLYEAHFQRVLQRLKAGDTLAQSMAATQAFPPLVVGSAKLGEEAGKLPSLLNKIASLYEENLEYKVNSLASIVEPVLMAVLGTVIAFIVLGTFLPMINLVQSL